MSLLDWEEIVFEALLLSSNRSSPCAGLIGVINICLNSLMMEDSVCRPGLPTSYTQHDTNRITTCLQFSKH